MCNKKDEDRVEAIIVYLVSFGLIGALVFLIYWFDCGFKGAC